MLNPVHSTAQFAVQRELGTSLADIAAFIHEQSLADGRESHAIERLRWLAVSLQNPPPDPEVSYRASSKSLYHDGCINSLKDPDPHALRSHDDESSKVGGT